MDIGKSVSRVGGKTQAAVLKGLAESLRLEYAQFLELEVFTRFGTMTDERTRKVIEHGRRIRSVLNQPQFAPLLLGEQVALLLALSAAVLDEVPLGRVRSFLERLRGWLEAQCPEVLALDDRAGALPDGMRDRVLAALRALGQQVAGEPSRSQQRDSPDAAGAPPPQ